MKALIIAISCLLSLSVSASVYQCRSYNTGRIIIANEELSQIILQDRFGNEVDVMDEVSFETDIIISDSVLIQTNVFNREGTLVFVLNEQDGKIKGTYQDDKSYQCKIRN